ncbi:plasma kallikrein-like [Hermetia illucens]|uniref:plasma kallikrein-like n=1 Tax=Hermetia illucens TaxID=343691 RepID=UPI0018CC6751|nr:plasma kallikrein-like [Hermetia illucens]
MVQLRVLYNSVLLLTTVVSCRKQCGKIEKRLHRIYGGRNVQVFYPWFMAFVAIPVNRLQPTITSVSCGGSLITRRDVLTAAHCLDFPCTKDKFVVFSGLENLCQPSSSRIYHRILRTVIHQKYNRRTGGFDIAIATLIDNVNKVPICLPSPKGKVPKRAEVIGFGYINDFYEVACKLQTIYLKIHHQQVCKRILTDYGYPVLENVICAGDLDGGLDSCQGDSGGPLQASKNDIYTIYGIVSFGFGCALPDTLGFYVDVSKFISWIEKFAYDRVVYPG